MLRVLEAAYPGRPAFDTAVSRALLAAVSRGEIGESLRLYEPDDVLAFSVLDRVRPGFPRAVELAREQGFAPMLRLAGGRAAVFTTRSLAFAWCIPVAEPRVGVEARFQRLAAIVRDALRALGVDARIGAVSGEYCPGDYSVNEGGRRKLMGVGQRLVRHAAHVGGVIVVREAARVAETLLPVYGAMGLEMDPAAVGSVDQTRPGTGLAEVREALLARFAAEYALEPIGAEPQLLAAAETLEGEHRL